MEKEPTITEVLEAVNKGFTDVETRISGVEKSLKADIAGLDKKIDGVEKRLEAKINTLTEHVDGFAKKQLDFDAELAAEQSARKRLEERIA